MSPKSKSAEKHDIAEKNIEEGVTPINAADQKTLIKTVSNKETVFIYVGPTNKYISRYTTYKNGYPEHIKVHLKECELLKNMFIDPSMLSDFEKNVITAGTVENIQFNEVKKYFEKGASK